MTGIEILIQRINQLTQTVSQLLNNSRNINQLPNATSGQKSVAVFNSSNNLTEQFNLSQALAGIGGLTNAILQTSTINRDGNEFEFGAGFIWQINNIEYTNPSSIFIEIPEATDGFFRIDIAVLNTNNDIVLIQGVESETSAIQPVTPQNTILLTVFNVFGSVINNPTPPIVGNEVVLKQYAQRFFANIPNDDPFFIQLQPTNQSYIVLNTTADDTIITGINLSSVTGADQPYPGQLFIIENSSNKPIVLEANGDGNVIFVLPNNQNLVFEPKNIGVFRYEGDDMQFLGFLNANLQQVLQQGATTNIKPTFEGGIKATTIESLEGEGVFSVGDSEMTMIFAGRAFQTPNDETGTQTFATREWVADNAVSSAIVVNTATFTAQNDRVYNTTVNTTPTDPTPVTGKGYTVNVISGVATIGGTAFPERASIFRSWNGSAWVNELKMSAVGDNVALESLSDASDVYGVGFFNRLGRFFRFPNITWNNTLEEFRIGGSVSIWRVISTVTDGNAGVRVRSANPLTSTPAPNIAWRFFDDLGDFFNFGTTALGKRVNRFFTSIRQFSGSQFVETEFFSMETSNVAETTIATYPIPTDSVLTIGCLNLNCFNSQNQMIFGRAQFTVKNVGGTITDISRDELRYATQYSEIVSGFVTNANSRIDVVISGTNVELRFRQTGTARVTTVQLEVKHNVSLKPA